jgi:hypothetical protein
LPMMPYAASLLSRELKLPTVVPRRAARSFEVSPFGEVRSISMIRSENSDIHHSPNGMCLSMEVGRPSSKGGCESWGRRAIAGARNRLFSRMPAIADVSEPCRQSRDVPVKGAWKHAGGHRQCCHHDRPSAHSTRLYDSCRTVDTLVHGFNRKVDQHDRVLGDDAHKHKNADDQGGAVQTARRCSPAARGVHHGTMVSIAVSYDESGRYRAAAKWQSEPFAASSVVSIGQQSARMRAWA